MGDPRSKRMTDKPIFLKKYNRSGNAIKNLLDEITERLVNEYGFIDWGYTNKPDLRFPCLGMVFCKFELYPPNNMRMFIRVDDLEYTTTLQKAGWTNSFFVSTRNFPAGRKWIETGLHEDTLISSVLQIIDLLRADRVQVGW